MFEPPGPFPATRWSFCRLVERFQSRQPRVVALATLFAADAAMTTLMGPTGRTWRR